MSIFSTFKKARKAAEEHKKATAAQQPEQKPPPVPYKHVPTHAVQDALSAYPTSWSPEETRARIAAARKRRSEMAVPTSGAHTMSRSYNHSRANSDSGVSSKSIQKTHIDLSIDSVIQKPTLPSAQLNVPMRGRQPTTPLNDYSLHPPEEYHAFSQPRRVPSPPRARSSALISNASSNTRRKSPLSNVSLDEDGIISQGSGRSSHSASSLQSLSTEESPRRSGSSQSRKKFPTLPNFHFSSPKRQTVIEISSPYGSDEEDCKTATSTIPTWRYEDLVVDTEPPTIVENISRTHSKPTSTSRAVLHKKNPPISAF